MAPLILRHPRKSSYYPMLVGSFHFLLHSFIPTEPLMLNPKRPLPGMRIDKLLGGQDSALLFFLASYFLGASGFRLGFTV